VLHTAEHNILAIQTSAGHYELQKETKPTTTKQLENRAPLKSMFVSQQKKKNPQESPSDC